MSDGGATLRRMDAQHQRWLDWVDRYEAAWRSPGTQALAGVFSPRAVYLTAPYAEPYEGLAAIAAFWDEGRDGAGEVFTLSRRVVAVDGSTGVVRCVVRYQQPRPQEYTDLWVVDLDEQDLCTRYEEWPFWPEKPHTAAS